MHLYPLLLFAIIVLSLLFLVMTGTGLYSAVVDSQTRNREARAALSYLAARVHAADAAGAVSVGEGPEGAALLLREPGRDALRRRLARTVAARRVLDLASDPGFHQDFIRHMRFGDTQRIV